MVKETGINLPVVDMGWQVTAIVAYSTKPGMIYLALGLIFQLIMFLTGWTNVFQPSGMWDLYSYALWGSLVYLATNNMALSIVFMLVLNLWATTLYEVFAKRWSKYYKYSNCTIVQLHNVDAVPFAVLNNWILNKFGAYKVRWKPEDLRERLGFMGDPIALGFILGLIIGILGNFKTLGTLASWVRLRLLLWVLLPLWQSSPVWQPFSLRLSLTLPLRPANLRRTVVVRKSTSVLTMLPVMAKLQH
jgi:PTS system galactitol-specific IIC component